MTFNFDPFCIAAVLQTKPHCCCFSLCEFSHRCNQVRINCNRKDLFFFPALAFEPEPGGKSHCVYETTADVGLRQSWRDRKVRKQKDRSHERGAAVSGLLLTRAKKTEEEELWCVRWQAVKSFQDGKERTSSLRLWGTASTSPRWENCENALRGDDKQQDLSGRTSP